MTYLFIYFDKRSGGIGKVDNSTSIGDKVEIMICDVQSVQSYLVAMHYMLSFNAEQQIVTWYWDEPTITLDFMKNMNSLDMGLPPYTTRPRS